MDKVRAPYALEPTDTATCEVAVAFWSAVGNALGHSGPARGGHTATNDQVAPLATQGPRAHDRRMDHAPQHATIGIVRGAAIALIPALVFARGLTQGFVYDDLALIAQNPGLHDPFDFVGLWTKPLWGEQLGHWRPLTAQLLAIGWALTPGSALGIHAISLLLHCMAAISLARVSMRLGLSRAAATAAALLFALHPANAETVAWCASLNDALLAACAIGAVDQWLRWRATGTHGARRAATALLVAAMLSKEPGVFALLLCLGVDMAMARAQLARRAVPCIAALAFTWIAARMLVFGELAAGFGRVTYAHPDAGLQTSLAVGLGLLRRLTWPFGLDMFEGPDAFGASSMIGAAAAGIVFWIAMRRGGVAGRVACLFACASVLPPMLTVGNLGPYPIASRYLALATAGLGVALASLCSRPLGKGVVALQALACAFGLATWLTIPMWRDQETFVERSTAQRPSDPRLHYMRGSLLLERAQQGDTAAAQRADTALLEAKRLLGDDLARNDHLSALRRDVATGLAWMSMLYAGQGGGPDWMRVERAFLSVIADWPDRADAYVGLGVARAASGRLELGQRDLERAIELDPGTPAAYFNLAKVLQMRGDLAGARARLLEALRIRPDDAQARAMLGDVERQQSGR